MASYNLMKRADRERKLADCKAEVTAIEAGTWPRNLDDQYRWADARTCPHNPPGVNHKIQADYAKQMCMAEIAYLEGVPARVAAGELPGWEA